MKCKNDKQTGIKIPDYIINYFSDAYKQLLEIADDCPETYM